MLRVAAVMTRDPTFEALAREVREAEQALIATAAQDPQRWWYPPDLRAQARNGWSAGAVGTALENLIQKGRFAVNADLCVRLRG